VGRAKRHSLGFLVVEWIEEFLIHGPGDVLGEPIVLDDEFLTHTWKAYELVKDPRYPKGWRRKYRRDFLSRSKGRAKSEYAAMIACAELLGPVRFDGFDANKEPVGRPVRSPEVLCFATVEEQAGNTYDNVYEMLSRGKVIDEYPVDPGLSRSFTEEGGEIRPVASADRGRDGGKSTFVVFDETHLWFTPMLKRTHGVVLRNLGKRGLVADPWSLETSTMYAPGEESIAEETHAYARDLEERGVDEGLLFDHRGSDLEPGPLSGFSDSELLGKLEEQYGPAAEWTDMGRILREIRDPNTDDADNRRYWFNQIVAGAGTWMDLVEWNTAKDEKTIPDGAQVVLGFAGARSSDGAAVVACDIESGHLFTLGFWEKDLTVPDWEVPQAVLDATVDDAFERFNVWRLYANPAQGYWDSTIDDWAGDYGAKRCIRWPIAREQAWAHAIHGFRVAVRSGHGLTHDGDPRARRHTLAAVRRVSKRAKDDQGKPMYLIDRPATGQSIFQLQAAVLAYEARGDAVAAGVLKKRYRAAGF
jgi:hypothetical protein